MTRTAAVLLGSTLILSACTAVSVKWVGADTALISASDDEASVPQAHSAALVAAAKLARQQGYEYFKVLRTRSSEATEWQYTPAGPIGSGNASSIDHPISHAGQDLEVRFLHAHDLPSDMDGVVSVAAVLADR